MNEIAAGQEAGSQELKERALALYEAEQLALLRRRAAHRKVDMASCSSHMLAWLNAHRRAWLEAFEAYVAGQGFRYTTVAEREAASERAAQRHAAVDRGACGCAICTEPARSSPPSKPAEERAPGAQRSKRSKKPPLNDDEFSTIEDYLERGHSQRRTAEILGATRGEVRWVADKMKRAGRLGPKVSASEAGRLGGMARADKTRLSTLEVVS
ncbi:MAG: hypothetical protein U1A78_41510 [Polyangia bacterium]